MIALIDSYVEPNDQGDIAPAWERALASGKHVIVFTPGATYATSKALVVPRRLLVVAWLATIFCSLGGFQVDPGGSKSLFLGVTVRASAPTTRAHGFLLRARAYLIGVEAWKFHGDGFHVDGVSGNANCGVMLGCFSTGHSGRGFSWRGADANAWTVLGCSTSNCGGEVEEPVEGDAPTIAEGGGPYRDGAAEPPKATTIVLRAAGFDCRAFLGTFFFGCHSGNHTGGVVPEGNAKPLGVALDSDSAGGCWVAGYQEVSHQVRVMAPNFAAGGIYELSPDSTAAQIGGTKNGAGWYGRVAFGRRDAVDARITMGAPKLGAVAELSRAGFGYLSIVSQAPWWVLRWRNVKDVIAFHEDGPRAVFPHGLEVGTNGSVGQTQKLDAARIASIEARLAALEAEP